MTAALDALVRFDHTTPLPGDAAVLAVFEKHCQTEEFVWPEPLCRHGNTDDYNGCFLDYDDLMRRASDV